MLCYLIFYFLLNNISNFNYLIQELNKYIAIPYQLSLIYLAIVLLAFPIAYIFFIVLTIIYRVVSYLGNYRKNDFLRVFGCNAFLTAPIYLTIWTILQPKNYELIAFFISSLIIIIAFLLSLRFLSNPTVNGFIKLYDVWDNTAIPNPTKEKIKRLKENVIGFYFSIIVVGIFYVIMFWLFNTFKPTSLSQPNICECESNLIWETPLPPIPIEATLVFIGGYILALFVATALLEVYLRKYKPIKI
jgi:hypothetical protein